MSRGSMLHRCRLALALALTLGGAAFAADAPAGFPATPPVPGPALPLSVPAPTLQTLPNGLEVLTVPRTDLPLVTARFIVRSGGEMDPTREAGLADLTANLLTHGAGGQSAPQLAAAAAALGGSLDAAAGWDESAIDITVTTPKLPAALALLATVVRQPDFAPAEVKRAQTQAEGNVRLALSQPVALASVAAGRAVFGDGAYGHARTGTPASLARITRDDVVRLHAQLYRPDNAILVFAGDITPAQALSLAQAGFGNWVKPATPLPAKPVSRDEGELPPLVLINQPGAGQAGVVAAHVAPPRSDRDYYVGVVANAVLGGSYSARLNEEIRIKRGLSYGASSRLQPLADTGLWLAAAQTKNPSAPEVVGLMRQQFAALGETPVPATELAARKATLIGGYGRGLETTAGLAQQIGDLAVYHLPLTDVGSYVAKVDAVTPKQVMHYAREWLGTKALHVVVVGDAAQFAPALQKTNPHALLLSADALDLDRATLQPAAAAKH